MFGTIAKFLPGVGSVTGAAIDGVVVYSITITSAYVYMKALLALAEADGINMKDVDTEINLTNAIKNVFKDDKDKIGNLMNDAKAAFKKEDMSDAAELDKKKKARQDQQAQQEKRSGVWVCTCGTSNRGNFCSNCGKKKP